MAEMNLLHEIVKSMEKVRKVPQLLYIGPISAPGALNVRAEIVALKLKNPEVNEIDFILNSPGGSPDDGYRIIRSLRQNFETVNIIIPFWAKSAATLLSLGGSTIVMDEFGEFGPLDMQLGKQRDDSPGFDRESALNDEHSVHRIETRFKEMYESMYIRLYEHKKINIPKGEVSSQLLENLAKFYEPLLSQINPYKLGEKRRKLDIGEQYAKRILLQFNNVPIAESRKLVDYLINACPDHGYIIDYAMISQFINYVKKPDEFAGLTYKTLLEQLSMSILFDEMSEKSNNHIGFIVKDEVVPDQGKKVSVAKPKKNVSKKIIDLNKEKTNFASHESKNNIIPANTKRVSK